MSEKQGVLYTKTSFDILDSFVKQGQIAVGLLGLWRSNYIFEIHFICLAMRCEELKIFVNFALMSARTNFSDFRRSIALPIRQGPSLG